MVDRNTDKKSLRRSSKLQLKEPQILRLKTVSEHCYYEDCWIIIYNRVYDITDFLSQHPAGSEILLEHAGCDATLAFLSSGHSNGAVKLLSQYLIGILPREERLFANANA